MFLVATGFLSTLGVSRTFGYPSNQNFYGSPTTGVPDVTNGQMSLRRPTWFGTPSTPTSSSFPLTFLPFPPSFPLSFLVSLSIRRLSGGTRDPPLVGRRLVSDLDETGLDSTPVVSELLSRPS